MSRPLNSLCFMLSLYATSLLAADAAAPAAKTAPVERQAVIERSQDDATALERQLPQDEQQSLQAGSETFLALWKAANTATPNGAVILLPGAGESADWPLAIGPLRRKLPDIGWSSLSLTLPDLQSEASLRRAALPAISIAPAPATDAKTSGTKPAAPATDAPPVPDPATDPASAEIQAKVDAERIFARIDAAVAFAKQQKSRTVVLLGHGTGAYWAARYLNEHSSAGISKLLLVAAESPFEAKPPLEDLTPSLKLTVGDFYYRGQPQADKLAKLRLQASKRQKTPAYSQVGLDPLPGNEALEEDQLLRRIRGVLSPTKTEDPPAF